MNLNGKWDSFETYYDYNGNGVFDEYPEYDYNEEGELIANSNMIAYRGLFLIDKEGVVQHQLVNNLPLGRNIDEAIRILDALQFHEAHGEVCPANWNKGDKAMITTNEGLEAYFQSDIKVIQKK